MGILSDLLTSPIGEAGYGAMAELYDQANIKAGDQQKLFQGLGQDLRVERSSNTKALNEKLTNFKAAELDFIKNAERYNTAYEGFSDEQLKLKFAPMANYLKGDTFLGKTEDVNKRVLQAIEMSGGFEKDDEYTTAGDFETQTRSAISKPLEAYSGLAYNTWQNQVGDGLAFKTPDYEQAGVVDSAFKITAENYPMFFKGPMKPSDNAVLDVARLALLNYNARNDSIEDGVLDIPLFEKLRTDNFNIIQKGPDKIDMTSLPLILGIDSNTFGRILTDDSPYLAALSSSVAKISGIVGQEGGVQTAEFRDLADLIKNYTVKHYEYVKGIQKAITEKQYSGIDVPEDTSAAALYSKLKIEHSLIKLANNDEKVGKQNAFVLSRVHKKISKNPESTKMPIEDGGTFGVHINKSPREKFEGETQEDYIIRTESKEYGRIGESFTFMLEPNTETTFKADDALSGGGEQTIKPKKWVAVSNTGVMFDIPSIEDLVAAQAGDDSKTLGRTYAANLNDFDRTNEGREELRAHLEAVIAAAMENKLDLSKRFKDLEYIKLLESQGVFGTNPETGTNVSYFGIKKKK